MSVVTLSARKLNENLGQAKRLASEGPVIVTDRGKPSHVLISFEQYRRLTAPAGTLGDLLADEESARVELPLPQRSELAEQVVL
jgi:prevent-host-death family protein